MSILGYKRATFVAGSDFGRMVEQAQASTVREIIAYLRNKTGEDLGDSAEPWIQKYAARK